MSTNLNVTNNFVAHGYRARVYIEGQEPLYCIAFCENGAEFIDIVRHRFGVSSVDIDELSLLDSDTLIVMSAKFNGIFSVAL